MRKLSHLLSSFKNITLCHMSDVLLGVTLDVTFSVNIGVTHGVNMVSHQVSHTMSQSVSHSVSHYSMTHSVSHSLTHYWVSQSGSQSVSQSGSILVSYSVSHSMSHYSVSLSVSHLVAILQSQSQILKYVGPKICQLNVHDFQKKNLVKLLKFGQLVSPFLTLFLLQQFPFLKAQGDQGSPLQLCFLTQYNTTRDTRVPINAKLCTKLRTVLQILRLF